MTASDHDETEIRLLGPSDARAWRRLWHDYLDFYETRLDPVVTERTWSRILEGGNMFGLGAHRRDEMIGFALVVIHPRTWSLEFTAYLEDLFVHHCQRGSGAGRLLVEEVIRHARLRHCASLYWHTHAANHAARALYDSYCAADQSVRYRLELSPAGK